MLKTTTSQAADATIPHERDDQSTAQPNGKGLACPGADGNRPPEPGEATPTSAEEFYAKLAARSDVRTFLKRLAGQ